MALITGTERVDLPHEAGEWFELRALPPKKLGEAADARFMAAQRARREMGVDFIRYLDEQRAERQDTPAAPFDPLSAYDLWTLLKLGIAGWSYSAPCSPETIEQLDNRTALWAARELLKLAGIESDPETARKNA